MITSPEDTVIDASAFRASVTVPPSPVVAALMAVSRLAYCTPLYVAASAVPHSQV